VANRTDDATVRAAISISPSTQTAIYIGMANSLTNKLALADAAEYSQLSAQDLLLIETLLACHFIASNPNEQQYSSRTTEGASASFQGTFTAALKSTKYGQDAMMLDVTNYLARHSKEVEDGYRRVASIASLAGPEWPANVNELDVGPVD
jgi:hypothetical protein